MDANGNSVGSTPSRPRSPACRWSRADSLPARLTTRSTNGPGSAPSRRRPSQPRAPGTTRLSGPAPVVGGAAASASRATGSSARGARARRCARSPRPWSAGEARDGCRAAPGSRRWGRNAAWIPVDEDLQRWIERDPGPCASTRDRVVPGAPLRGHREGSPDCALGASAAPLGGEPKPGRNGRHPSDLASQSHPIRGPGVHRDGAPGLERNVAFAHPPDDAPATPGLGRAAAARLRRRRSRVPAVRRTDARARGDSPTRGHAGDPHVPRTPRARSAPPSRPDRQRLRRGTRPSLRRRGGVRRVNRGWVPRHRAGADLHAPQLPARLSTGAAPVCARARPPGAQLETPATMGDDASRGPRSRRAVGPKYRCPVFSKIEMSGFSG